MNFLQNIIMRGTLTIAGVLAVVPIVSAAGNNANIFRPGAIVPGAEFNTPNFQLAQSGDAAFRVNQLEEQVRQLNGKIEELNFLLLQMQEQLRRMREDNEFRFQELEDKKQGSLTNPGDDNTSELADARVGQEFRVEKSQPSELAGLNSSSDGQSQIVSTRKQPRMIDGVEIYDGPSGTSEGQELPLGTITFDSLGNIVDTALGKPVDLTASLRNGSEGNSLNIPKDSVDFASITNAKELYDLGYDYFQSGDYHNSKIVFSDFTERFPDDRKIATAQFWLGESMFSQSDFKGAAQVFLETHTNWPEAKIAPQALLKLGVSLAGMQQRELACATYVKVYKKYPDISNAMRKRIKAEQKSAHCLNG